jgi:TRAP-type mannitol/chloroaromatic compound transport system permease small subunit
VATKADDPVSYAPAAKSRLPEKRRPGFVAMGIFPRMAELADRIDRFNAAIGRAAAWAALFIVLMQFAVVVLRYAFGIGSIWLSESIVYGHASLFMLAAAWTLRENGHVRVDVFYSEASARTKALIDLVGALLLLIPFMLVLAAFAVPYVARSWAILERSRETSGLPLVFLLKTLIPAFAVLFALQGVSQAIRAATVLAEERASHGVR